MNSQQPPQPPLLSRQQPRRKARSLRHFWLSLRHALTWAQLKQTFHYRNVFGFIKRHWFAPTVIVLLLIIAYRHLPPIWQSADNLHPQTAQALPQTAKEEPLASADFAADFAQKDNESPKEQKSDEVVLPPDLPAASPRKTLDEQNSKLPKQYIQRFLKVAQDEHKKYGIPASVTLGLAMLCSDFGMSDKAQQYNNHFETHCENNKFQVDAELITKNGDCFVKYPTAWAGFRSNSLLITSGKYKELAKVAKNEVATWASGLERLGYPNPNFSADKLLEIIKLYNLQKYD